MSEVLSDFTGTPSPAQVKVGGVSFNLSEFDMRTRALWLDVSKEFGLPEMQTELHTKVIPKISSIAREIESDPRVKSVDARLQRLQAKHDELMELYATDDEPDDIDEQLTAVVARMESQREELARVTEEVQSEVFGETQATEEKINDFMEAQDRARVNFVWRLAKASDRTDLEFEEFYERCGSGDYEAAERFVLEGNARWASLQSSRMQTKPKKSMN